MLTLLGRKQPVCEGISRRTLLQAGGAGLFGLTLPKLLQAEAAVGPALNGRAKSVIFLFLFGGPSQLETFDLKPDAPSKIRGPFKPIASRTPELRIGELLPRTAAITDKLCVIRTMTHPYNDHSGGGHYIQTGRQWQIPIGGGFNATPKDWPSIGSVVEYVAQHGPGGTTRELPNYAVVPNFLGKIQEYRLQLRRPGEYAGWLGAGYNPLTTTIDKRGAKDNPYFRACGDEELNYQIQGLAMPEGVSLDRLNHRRQLRDQLDDQLRAAEKDKSVAAFDRFRSRAWSLVTSEKTRTALDIRREPAELRDRYGRNLFGQSVLLARRLVEAGVRYCTVHWDAPDGYSWDSHVHSDDVTKHLIPGLDAALSSLITDLDQRGLLDETLVVCLGEMGRTPAANDKWGRNHWSTLFPAVLAGAGVRGGICYGSSDKDAAYPIDKPVRPEDLAATIYEALGIDPHLQLPDAFGRPINMIEGGRPLSEIFG